MEAGSARWLKQLLLWAVIIAALVLVFNLTRLPERLGCHSDSGWGGRGRPPCRYTLLSPETWRALPAR